MPITWDVFHAYVYTEGSHHIALCWKFRDWTHSWRNDPLCLLNPSWTPWELSEPSAGSNGGTIAGRSSILESLPRLPAIALRIELTAFELVLVKLIELDLLLVLLPLDMLPDVCRHRLPAGGEYLALLPSYEFLTSQYESYASSCAWWSARDIFMISCLDIIYWRRKRHRYCKREK